MKPMFFGDPDSPLYGVYQPPRAAADGAPAVLACYPAGSEYMRAHRAFRQLTTLLNKGGAHVLRFDWHGTGDSAGAGDAVLLSHWIGDVATAVAELRELSGAQAVTLVGLRFGATLAALAGAALPDVQRLVLWDPVVDGRAYVEDLEAKHQAEQRVRGASDALDGTIGAHGFPFGASLRREMRGIDLTQWTPSRPVPISLVVSADRAEYVAVRDALAARGLSPDFRVSPSDGRWDEVDAFGSALIPQQIIQDVVGAVMEVRA